MSDLTEWLISKKLHTNTIKTIAMLFLHEEENQSIDENLVEINGDTILFSTHTKFKGVSTDNDVMTMMTTMTMI